MSFPVPYTEGMVVTATAQDREGRELLRIEGPPIRPSADGVLRPMFGPDWVRARAATPGRAGRLPPP